MSCARARSRRRFGAAVACAWIAAACSGEDAAPSGSPTARSAVLVTLDTTRADALSCSGAPPGMTPFLDAFAQEGVLYLNARTVAPITLPAHASMLTGLYPPRHTVRDNGLRPLPPSAETLAERARDSGYETAAFVASIVLDGVFGLNQGFETYDVPAAKQVFVGSAPDRSGEKVVDATLAWLAARDRSKPFFLWVHFFDPHHPHEAPQVFVQRARGHPYLAEVAAMDAAFGRLMKGLREDGALGDAFVAVVGDHGEGLTQHDEETHGSFVFDTTMKIPFMLRYPDGHRAGERSQETVSAVDVFGTLADAMGLEPDRGIDGVSLYRRLVASDRKVYFESYFGFLNYGWSPLAGWADEHTKYVHSSQPRFYDVRTDPLERRDVLANHDAESFRDALAAFGGGPALEGGGATVDEGMVDELRKLGYAAAGDMDAALPPPAAPSNLPDPHSRAAELRKLSQAQRLISQRQIEPALKLLQEVDRDNPGNVLALQYMASCHIALEDYAAAAAVFERVLSSSLDRADPRNNYGFCLEKLGRPREAIAQYRRALELTPTKLEALRNLARVLRNLGETDELPELQARIRAVRGE